MGISIRLQSPTGAAGSSLRRFVGQELEEAVGRFNAGAALECTRVLKRTRGNLWPIRTGNSRDRWLVEDVDGQDKLLASNSAPYAAAVNNSRSLRGGRPNRNFEAAQRTILKFSEEIIDGALEDI